jgi:energy-coupling factor transporter ATP-binding protein EcfA2
LAEIIDHPSVVLVCGHRGGGKTALVLRLQELLRPRAAPHALGMPQGVERLLPDWYGLAGDISDVPPNSVVYVPEAYRLFHARSSHAAQGRIVADLVNISRHRRHTLIFDVQNPAHLDRNIVSEVDVVLVKEPGPFQGGFERSQLRDVLDTARAAFAGINPVRKKRAVCVFAPRRGMHGLILENDLPSFWSEGLSRAFGKSGQLSAIDGSDNAPTRKGRRASNEALASQAKARRAAGYSYGEIGKMLGVSKTQAYRLVNEQS